MKRVGQLAAVILACVLTEAPICQASSVKPKDAIQHIVVIFQENVSFDHYFATYRNALNPEGEPKFTALPETPKVEGLSGDLLNKNPNFLNEDDGAGRANPFRLPRDQAAAADQSHNYEAEQLAFNHCKMDLFPKSVGHPDGPHVPGEHTGIPSTFWPDNGLLRRKYGDRVLELCAALCNERSPVWLSLWSIDSGCNQPRFRHNERRSERSKRRWRHCPRRQWRLYDGERSAASRGCLLKHIRCAGTYDRSKHWRSTY